MLKTHQKTIDRHQAAIARHKLEIAAVRFTYPDIDIARLSKLMQDLKTETHLLMLFKQKNNL